MQSPPPPATVPSLFYWAISIAVVCDPDEKILCATEVACFPKGMKLSGLEDMAYFSSTHDGSPTDSESSSSDSSSLGSTSIT